MNRQNHKTPSRARGITLVEILIVLSVLVVLASFAMPSMSSATAKAEMTAAVENVQYSIQSARNAARMSESQVTLGFQSRDGEDNRVIIIQSEDSPAGEGFQEFLLPEEIAMVTDQESFVFDGRGLVERTGSIILVAKADESITSTVSVD